jgi:hypothetical protein
VGDSDAFDEIKLELVYRVEKGWMLKANLHTKIIPRVTAAKRNIMLSRILTILLAAILLLLEARTLSSKSTFGSEGWWSVATMVFCFLIIISNGLSPFMSMMLLLPYLEKTGNQYLFTYTLRYALPIILSLWSNVLIFLSGIILYSMLAYQTVMFESFHRSFFSYIYNNFQYATYEIFLEIRNKGIIAHLIYLSLYFYMVLVAHSLIPSVFCALVRMRGAERNLQKSLAEINTTCPNCEAPMKPASLRVNESEVSITIVSPKLTPFVHERSLHSPKINAQSNKKKFFIIEEDLGSGDPTRKSKTQLIADRINYSARIVE